MPILGKIKQKDNVKYMVVKTKKGYYPRAKSEKGQRIGPRHYSASAARKTLKKWMD
jgi:hypothetical protein